MTLYLDAKKSKYTEGRFRGDNGPAVIRALVDVMMYQYLDLIFSIWGRCLMLRSNGSWSEISRVHRWSDRDFGPSVISLQSSRNADIFSVSHLCQLLN